MIVQNVNYRGVQRYISQSLVDILHISMNLN